MTTRYCGIGGNDGNSGLTWALRKLTLDGVEDTPVVAGDVCYIGPGVYRELLTVDVSGGAGTEITYIGDVTGEHTDGVGGVVRITGSDNDQTTARNNCIVSTGGEDYRTWRGLYLDMSTQNHIYVTGVSTNWIIEDCVCGQGGESAIKAENDAMADFTVRRCTFYDIKTNLYGCYFNSTGGNANSGHVVENCVFIGQMRGVGLDDTGGVTIRNCTFVGGGFCIIVIDALPGGYTAISVTNCTISSGNQAIRAVNLGEIVEDYNALSGNATDRVNVNVGGNSVTYPPLFKMSILHAGASQASGLNIAPTVLGELSQWSQIAAITGADERTVDLLGIGRPVTAAKNSWGAVQYQGQARDTGTTYDGSTAALTLPDAGRVQFKIPTADATEITISVRAYREANYAGTNPRLIIKQPGQADDTTTDAAAASQWNELTTTLTPAAPFACFRAARVVSSSNGSTE